MDILRANNRVCFEVDVDHETMEAEEACQWGMRYRSVIGFGKAFLVDDTEEKRRAYNVIMNHYSSKLSAYSQDALDKTLIIKVVIDEMTGKQSGY